MNAKRCSLRPMQAAILAASLVVASGTAFAQQATEVTIQAARPLQMKRGGVPVEVVSITHRVSYADLDLATQKGGNELEKRINETAAAVCKQIDALSPPMKAEDLSCTKKAAEGAMKQARAAIVAAETAANK